MKRIIRTFVYLLLSVVLLFTILLVTISLSQNKLVDMALTELSETLKAPIEVDEVSFTLFKRFPYSTFQFSGVRVGEQHASTINNQSSQNILYANHAFISVKTFPLFSNKFEAIRIEIEDANITYHIDSLGGSNIDFLLTPDSIESPDSSTTDLLFIDLKELQLKEITVLYANDSNLTKAKLYIPELVLTAKITPQNYTVKTKGSIEISDCHIDSTQLDKMDKLRADFSVQYEEDALNIEHLNLLLDGAQLTAKGKVAFSDVLFTDIHLKLDGLELAELIKYVPQEILEENSLTEVAGLFTLNGTIKGIVNDSVMPYINVDYELTNGKIISNNYPSIQRLELMGSYTNGAKQNNETTTVDIKKLYLATKNSKVDATLLLKNLDRPTYTISSTLNLSLAEFKSQIPDSIAQNISGRINTSFSTHGTVPDSIDDAFIHFVLNHTHADVMFEKVHVETDSVTVNDFSGKLHYAPGKLMISGLNISIPNENIQLSNTSLDATITGNITQAEHVGIQLHSFHIQAPQGEISGTGFVQNLDHPTFQLNAHSIIHLSALKPFLSDTLITNLSGDIETQIMTEGRIHLDSISTQITPILMEDSRFSFAFKNVNASLPDTLMQIRNFSGNLDFIPDTISISNMEGTALGIDFTLDSTTIANYYATLIQNKPELLSIKGNLALGDLDKHIFDALLSEKTSSENPNTIAEEDTSAEDSALYSIHLKGKISVKSINYNHPFIDNVALVSELDDSTKTMLHSYLNNQIIFKNISVKLNYADSLIIVEDFVLNAFGGQLNSSARMWIKDQHTTIINIRNSVENVDMKKMLIDINELGQSGLITSDNISGLLSGTMYTRFLMENDAVIQDEFYANGTFKLENGGLYNYKPAMDMRKFTGIKELDNIVFKTIETDLFILSNKVFIPKTHMVSTALDVSIFGMQNLANDDFEFHTHINLGDVLTGKNPKLFERQEKDGDIVGKKEKSRGAIKLVYLQEDGKTKTKFDTKKMQKNMDIKIRLQKGLLGVAFNPYLVSFDTGIE